MISSQTIELIEKFKQAPWFENVGKPLEDDSVVPVNTWDVAMKLCLSYDWRDDVLLDAKNRLSIILERDHRKRSQDWNKIGDEVDDRLNSPMEKVARSIIADRGLPKEFEWVIVYTTGMACIEAEYSDIVPPAFFMQLASWYLAGHLPCGMTGKSPQYVEEDFSQYSQTNVDLQTIVMQQQHQLFGLKGDPYNPALDASRKLMVF